MTEIEIFGNFLGLMINRNKTEGLWIGKLKHSKDKEENIKWTNKPIKTLGMYHGHDYIECEKLNYFLPYLYCVLVSQSTTPLSYFYLSLNLKNYQKFQFRS
jgi:hypothetical protein